MIINNKTKKQYKIGVCISSYITNEITYNIMKKSIISLLHTASIIDDIFIIDDHSPYQAVFHFYRSIEKRIKTIKNPINTGIASVKNQSLTLLKDYDIIILSDNDNLFHVGWDTFYCENFIKTNIHNVNLHNSFSVFSDYQKTIIIKGVEVDLFTRFFGNFIMLDQEILNNVGGFPLLKNVYGQEHHNLQKRINRYLKREDYYYDFKGSKRYIKNLHHNDSFCDRKEKTKMSIENAKETDLIFESKVVYLPIKTKLERK